MHWKSLLESPSERELHLSFFLLGGVFLYHLRPLSGEVVAEGVVCLVDSTGNSLGLFEVAFAKSASVGDLSFRGSCIVVVSG